MTTAQPILDQEKLSELREIFEDDSELAELFQEFFGELPTRLQDLHQAFEIGATETIHQNAHALKGSSGNLGAAAVHATARAIEEYARSGSLQEACSLMPRLETEVAQLAQALQQLSLL